MVVQIEWGEPQPAEWAGPRETLTARLPVDLAREVRERARVEGISVSMLIHRLVMAGMGHRTPASGAAHADLMSTLFD